MAVTKVHARGVQLMWAKVRQEPEYAVVTGSLTLKGVANRKYSGHVDVEFMDSDGKLIERAHSETIYVAQRGPGKGSKLRRFSVRLKTIAPQNGNVRVVYHLGSHNPGDGPPNAAG